MLFYFYLFVYLLADFAERIGLLGAALGATILFDTDTCLYCLQNKIKGFLQYRGRDFQSLSKFTTKTIPNIANLEPRQVFNQARGTKYFREDYMFYNNLETFYKVHAIAENWLQAKQICEAEGTTLFVPDSVDEMEYIKVLMSNIKFQHTAIFVGIHDLYADGNYVTIKGEYVTGTIREMMWAEGCPDSFNNSEHCVAMDRVALLDDRLCSELYPYICKIQAKDIKYNIVCNMYDPGYQLHSIDDVKCYKFHQEPLSWYDAYMTCTREQGELVIINSPEEANVVTAVLRDHINSNVPNPNILYIGFSDLLFPHQYRTIKGDTLEVAGYSSFNPVKETLKANKTKRCGAISRAGYLIVTHCDRPAMFLCQKILNNDTEVKEAVKADEEEYYTDYDDDYEQ